MNHQNSLRSGQITDAVKEGLERFADKVRHRTSPDFTWEDASIDRKHPQISATLKAQVTNAAHKLGAQEETASRIVNFQLGLASPRIAAAAENASGTSTALGELLQKFHILSLPHLIEGFEESPVHHIAHVVEAAVKIGIAEKLPEPELASLVLAALFHDVGIGQSELPKIAESRVNLASPELRDELRAVAIASRLEHMEKGARIARALMRDHIDEHGEHASLLRTIASTVEQIVAEHDFSKIPLLESSPGDYRKWLLGNTRSDWLKQLHWEADALWMLSRDGLAIDLARTAGIDIATFQNSPADTPQARLVQLGFNLSLHRKVVELYETAFSPEEFASYGFPPSGLLYRSKGGQLLADAAVDAAVTDLRATESPAAQALGLPAPGPRLLEIVRSGEPNDRLAALTLLGLGLAGKIDPAVIEDAARTLDPTARMYVEAAKTNAKFIP